MINKRTNTVPKIMILALTLAVILLITSCSSAKKNISATPAAQETVSDINQTPTPENDNVITSQKPTPTTKPSIEDYTVVVPIGTYNAIWDFSDDLVTVYAKDNNYGLIDRTGNIVVPLEQYDVSGYAYSEGMARVRAVGEQYFGYTDMNGDFVTLYNYPRAHIFQDGVAVTYNDDMECGVINKTGELVVPYGKYRLIDNFNNGVAMAMNAEKQYGVINKNSDLIVPFGLYKIIWGFNDGVAVVQNDKDEWGVIDSTGELIIPFGLYSNIEPFNSGVAIVKNDGPPGAREPKWIYGLIDKTGELVIPYGTFESIYDFNKGVATVRDTEGIWQLIDTNGKIICPLSVFGDIGGFQYQGNGLAIVWRYNDAEDASEYGILRVNIDHN